MNFVSTASLAALALLTPIADAAVSPSAPASVVVQSNRPDQVFEQGRRSVRPVSGQVTANELDGVVIEVDGKERTIDASKVVRVQLNRVPQAYRDGMTLLSTRQYVAAADSFLAAAGDGDASEPAQAAARHQAARALLWGTGADPDRARQSVAAAERFLSDHENNREAPEVRLLLGRAQWLSGDAAAAASTLEALYREAESGEAPVGYRLETCFSAGLLAARAALVADDGAKAQELFTTLESQITSAIGSLEADDARLGDLEALRAQAQLGEGHQLLSSGKATQAESFFRARLSAGEVASERTAARLGLALAIEADGRAREAQLLFAQVSATAQDSGDDVAAALMGLARTSLSTSEPGGRDRARTWLEEIRDRFGASLSAREAHEALAGL